MKKELSESYSTGGESEEYDKFMDKPYHYKKYSNKPNRTKSLMNWRNKLKRRNFTSLQTGMILKRQRVNSEKVSEDWYSWSNINKIKSEKSSWI